MKRRALKFALLLTGILCCAALAAQAAPKRLTITPTRIIVDARERSGELTIMNVFSEAATYRVQIVNNKMTEDGLYKTLSTPLDPRFNPEEFVRLTPRQFRLEPQASQRIRLSVRRPPDLPPGDYRFHVMVTRLANVEPSGNQGQKGIDLSLSTNLGISIPVVVRQGDYNGDVKIEDVKLESASNGAGVAALLTVKRIGDYDVFGGVRVFWEPQGGEREQIGLINNTNVFHEIERRTIKVALAKRPQGPGKLIVQYVEDFYKQGVIDEMVLDL